MSNIAVCGKKKINLYWKKNFQKISLKWIKSKTIFYWLERQIYSHDLLKGLVRPFTKHRVRIQKCREKGNLKHIYRNKLDKACFSHDAAYSHSKDLAKRTISDNILKDKAYEIAINCNYDGYQRALSNMVCKIFDKKTGSGAIATSKSWSECEWPTSWRIIYASN